MNPRRMDGQTKSQEIKLLLLGTAECGKSTILKQMRILHDNGFTPEELNSYKETIYNFMIKSMLKVVDAMPDYSTNFTKEEQFDNVNILRKAYASGCNEKFFNEHGKRILEELWSDPVIQSLVDQHGEEFHLTDAATHFFNGISRIGCPGYKPTERDILRVRVETTGVVEVPLTLRKSPVKVVDVGGQRSQRRKWIHYFDDVSSVFFIMALNEYDQFLEEDRTTDEKLSISTRKKHQDSIKRRLVKKPRMSDSFRLFAYISNHEYFLKTGMILMMNKKDLFEKKLQTVPLTHYFKRYTGPNSYVPAVTYVKEQFLVLNKVETRPVYVHYTCATDTEQVKFVLDACFDIILHEALGVVGFA